MYFDESGTHRGARLMSMAGYWFDEQQASRFSRDWQKDLASFGISHAHMTDCALGYGEYRSLTKAQRVKIQTRLTEHIKRRSRFGFGICISPVAYDRAMDGIAGAPSAYSLCLMLCMTKVSDFARAIGYDGSISYCFEAGHAKAREAQKYCSVIPTLGPETVEKYRYGGHAFMDKRDALPLQAADMFAWHLRHYYERRLDGTTKPRKDYVALHRKFDFQVLISGNDIEALRETFVRLAPLLDQGRVEDAANVGSDILKRFGLVQMPVWIPKNTRVARARRSDKTTVRF